jgi:putative photosynthetic complex assembly protein
LDAQQDAAAGRVLAERHLRFTDASLGGLKVSDALTGQHLDTLHGEQGFVRGTLRGLLRERKRLNLPSEAHLLLQAHADGRLTLQDSSTGERLDLLSFGSANAGQYARWLPQTGQSAGQQSREPAHSKQNPTPR